MLYNEFSIYFPCSSNSGWRLKEILMRKQLLAGILILILTVPACLLTSDQPEDVVNAVPAEEEYYTDLVAIYVFPQSGTESFEIVVVYSAFTNARGGIPIRCYYITPSGMTFYAGTITPPALEQKTTGLFGQVEFNVRQASGKIETGKYTAGCLTEMHKRDIQTSFLVVEITPTPTSTPLASNKPAAKATATLAPLPTATATPTPTTATRANKGRIIFDYAKGQSSRAGAAGEAAQVTNMCIPEITINTAGGLSGSCEKTNTTGHLVTNASFTVTVVGAVDAMGKIHFSYDVSEIGNPNGAWRVSYEGEGVLTSPAAGAGTATFSYSCVSGSDNLLWCGSSPSESFSGSLPWNFLLSQSSP